MKKSFMKLLSGVLGVFGLIVFIILVLVSDQSGKTVSSIISLIGVSIYILEGAFNVLRNTTLVKTYNLHILPTSIILILLYLVSWVFIP
ncbi:hypothetical protein MNBD_GAMMA01-1143 [hydrothermal vent metagenome]|uniref:Uncharacterized protein n=1 Tax=hydrothermal vent metagenome TaxID=652676 RepID=A0A3B0VAG5_9ZZZZ